ncbi:hypothetical protein F3157_08135 [Virgibacillus dakarensis]|nr:hypothetical protein [Virgibacillus dakarensis]
MFNSLTYNNIRKPYVRVIEKERPYWASIERNIVTVPKRIGGRLNGKNIGALVLPVKLRIEGDSKMDLLDKTEDLAAWLITDEEKPLVFDDRPNRTYYAVIEGDAIPESEIVSFSTLQINFICPDPRKYGKEHKTIALKKYTWEEYAGQTWKELIDGNDN